MIKSAFISIGLLLSTGLCFASLGGKPIHINLVVFKQAHANPQTNPAFPLRKLNFPGSFNLMASAKSTSDAVDTPPYQISVKPNASLIAIERQLTRKGYQVILPLSWNQNAIQTNTWLHIYGGQAFNDKGLPVDTDASGYIIDKDQHKTSVQQQIDALEGGDDANGNAQISPTYWQINGLARVSYDGVFTGALKLYITSPVSLGDLQKPDYQLIPLAISRFNGSERLKLGQTAYFDNPMYGVVMTVSS
jgi:hypothetical protein